MSTCLRGGTVLAAAGAALMLGLAAPAEAGGCGEEYTVRPGDTLSGIARQCETTIDALLDANAQISNPASLSIGWKLNVPGDDEGLATMAQVDGPVELRGWIVNGQRCAMLATPDGEEYGVVSPELSFVSGRPVAVQGRMIDDPSCAGPSTLLVTQLTTTEL